MRVRFGRWKSGALAPLAALFANFVIAEAGADGLAPSRDVGGRAPPCSADQNCVRISGYIPAGSDFAGGGKIGGNFGPLTSPTVRAGAADAASRGMVFLPVSQDDSSR